MKEFKGRVVVPGTCRAEALVSHGGFNTLASYQMALMFGDKKVKCGDQNNADLYKKPMLGKALCLPMTIGSTTGGMVLFTACALGKQPACMLFSMPIDSLAASGAILGDVWTDSKMPVVDSLGDEFLQYVQTGMTVTVGDDGVVTVSAPAPTSATRRRGGSGSASRARTAGCICPTRSTTPWSRRRVCSSRSWRTICRPTAACSFPRSCAPTWAARTSWCRSIDF